MTRRAPPIPFAGSELDTVRHVCAFFSSEDEFYRTLLPFIADGFSCGDKAVHVVRPDQELEHLRRLSGAGIDHVHARDCGQLELRHNTDTYLKDGRFDLNRMLAAFEAMASGNAGGAFPLSRIICNMDWALGEHSHHHQLIEFEARVNDVWARNDDAVICVYDLKKFSGEMVIDMLRTHPMVILGGVLQVNPFFVPPQEFLAERAAARGLP